MCNCALLTKPLNISSALSSVFHRKYDPQAKLHSSMDYWQILSGPFRETVQLWQLESALDRKRVKRCNSFCSHCCNDCIPSGSQWEVRFEKQRDRDACKLLFGNHTLQQGRFRFLTNKRFMLSRPSISCLGSTHTTLRFFWMPIANMNLKMIWLL